MHTITALTEFANAWVDNLKSLSAAFPAVSAAAEAINQTYQVLTNEDVVPDVDDIPGGVAATITFAAHVAWAEAYVLVAAGQVETGLAALRRYIEYTAYAAKVGSSEKRARDWMHQRTDIAARRSFSGECRIPLAYAAEKYNDLWQLLVVYDMSSYFGVHGNWETVATKVRSVDNEKIILSYQTSWSIVLPATGLAVLMGYRGLTSAVKTLHSNLGKEAHCLTLLPYVSEAVRQCRLTLTAEEFGSVIPDNIWKATMSDDQTRIREDFQALVAREKSKGKSTSGVPEEHGHAIVSLPNPDS